MGLLGQQIEELKDALIDAFLDKVSLEEMLLTKLNRNLREIADERNLKDIIFKLIQIAVAGGWVEDLVCAAYEYIPGNQKLQFFIQNISLKKSNDLRVIIEQWLGSGYSDLEEIGLGAFGITYRAKINKQQKYIVIKTIKVDELYQIIRNDDRETEKQFINAIKSFEEEAEFLSCLNHKNIVKYDNLLKLKLNLVVNRKQDNTLYSVYKLELPFLIMEYIEGENLEEYVKRNFPIKETEALNYIRQIAEALIVVHDKNILHRDIKPKNIMLRKDKNEAVLIDFGIAREFIPNITETHTVLFTQGYAPPEQLIAKAQRGRYTDIYALAATLYYLLTGRHPIHALNRRNELLEEPKKLNYNISDKVNKAILWGMELEHIKRPQTVQQWLKNLYCEEQIGTGIKVKNIDAVSPHDGLKAKNTSKSFLFVQEYFVIKRLQNFLTWKVGSVGLVLILVVSVFQACKNYYNTATGNIYSSRTESTYPNSAKQESKNVKTVGSSPSLKPLETPQDSPSKEDVKTVGSSPSPEPKDTDNEVVTKKDIDDEVVTKKVITYSSMNHLNFPSVEPDFITRSITLTSQVKCIKKQSNIVSCGFTFTSSEDTQFIIQPSLIRILDNLNNTLDLSRAYFQKKVIEGKGNGVSVYLKQGISYNFTIEFYSNNPISRISLLDLPLKPDNENLHIHPNEALNFRNIPIN